MAQTQRIDDRRLIELLDILTAEVIMITNRKRRELAFDAIREIRALLAQQELPL